MSTTSFTIGFPRLIHPKLIAILADLQSTVIFTTDGKLIGWVHELRKTITFAEGYTEYYNALYYESEMSATLINDYYTREHFKINGTISYREWDFKTMFIYPPLPPDTITIASEHNY